MTVGTKHALFGCGVLLLLCSVGGVTFAEETPFVAYPQPHSPYEAMVNLAQNETHRIQEHLLFVEEQLTQRDVAHLTSPQRTNRANCIELLAAYREDGCFPQNQHTPGLRPVFIDDRGTACAVGHLMIVTGAGDVARSVAESQNLAYVPDISDTRVLDWANRMGLTVDECALIQPAYGFCPQLPSLSCQMQGNDVLLSWTLAPQHLSVFIYRDGVWLTSIPATDGTTFVDAAPSNGLHTYEVYADCGIASLLAPEICTIDVQTTPSAVDFKRGDCNGDSSINLADAVFGLAALFISGSPAPPCEDACDCNDDGVHNLADEILLLNGLFSGDTLPAPYPNCGTDTTADPMTCATAPVCP